MRAKHPSSAAQYVPALTGIRALAALLVLGMHTEQNVPAGLDSLLPFFARGYLGVDFFFVLSGFIITHVYFASLASPSRSAVQIFLWHRLIRLYPVHITILAGLVAIVSLAHAAGFTFNNPQEWQWNELLWQLTLLHAWGVTASPGWNAPSWSISAEWFAYLLFPLLAAALMWVRERAIALLIAVAALAATALLFAVAGWTLNTWVGAPALARVFGEFVCGAALCRAVALSNKLALPRGDILATSAFVACLGEISYSVYMVHFPVLIIIRRLWEWLGFAHWQAVGHMSAFMATVVLILALAATLFYVVERPARSRLRDQMGKLAPA